MKILLITGIPAVGKRELSLFLQTVIPNSHATTLSWAKSSHTPLRDPGYWSFTEHLTFARQLWESWRSSDQFDWLIVTTPTRDYQLSQAIIPPSWIPHPPSPAEAMILVEDTPQRVAPHLKKSVEHASTLLIKERLESHRLAQECGIPFFPLSQSHRDYSQIWLEGIGPFLESISLTPPELSQILPFSQEIQCSVREADPETQKEMEGELNQLLGSTRTKVGWETWSGVFFKPPEDEALWTEEEFRKIIAHLDAHLNVISVDVPIQGTEGHAKSTR